MEELELTGARIHDLALQKWLYDHFFVREGYPIPVVFSSPMDAFANFRDLWKMDNNPFSYLLGLKDASGKPLYEPYPSVPRYPLISIHRTGVAYRTEQNFSIHKDRKWNWPTISGAADGLTARDLGRVQQIKMPMAWNFNYQLDHFSMRPDSQAIFMQKFMKLFWMTGGTPQAWVSVNYPGWNRLTVRMVLEGGTVENLTPPEPAEGSPTEYRTAARLRVEGYLHDAYPKEWPTFWTLVVGTRPLSPEQLNVISNPAEVTTTTDERQGDTSFAFDGRTNPPPQPVQ